MLYCDNIIDELKELDVDYFSPFKTPQILEVPNNQKNILRVHTVFCSLYKNDLTESLKIGNIEKTKNTISRFYNNFIDELHLLDHYFFKELHSFYNERDISEKKIFIRALVELMTGKNLDTLLSAQTSKFNENEQSKITTVKEANEQREGKRVLFFMPNPCLDVTNNDATTLLQNPKFFIHPGGRGCNGHRAYQGKSLLYTPIFGEIGKLFQAALLSEKNIHLVIPSEKIYTTEEMRLHFLHTPDHPFDEVRFVQPSEEISEEKIEVMKKDILSLLQEGDDLVFAGNFAENMTHKADEIIKEAKEKGVRVYVDAKGKTLIEATKACPFMIKANNDEFLELLRNSKNNADIRYPSNLEEKEKFIIKEAQQLIEEEKTENIIITTGKYGAILVSTEGKIYKAVPPNIDDEIKSTVAAGDSLFAGFIEKMNEPNNNMHQALRYASGYGAATSCRHATEIAKPEEAQKRAEQVQLYEWKGEK